MKNRKEQLACYVPADLAERFRALAKSEGMTVSSALSALIEREVLGRRDHSSFLLRELLFVSTGVDALLTTHPDSTLRTITLNAHQARLRSEGLVR